MFLSGGQSNGTCVFEGLSPDAYRLPNLSVLGGEILSVSSAAKNLSYSVSFHGPAIGCKEADNTTSTFVQRAIEDYNNSTDLFLYWSGFIPTEYFGPEMNGSYIMQIGNGTDGVANNLDLLSKDASKIYQTLYFSNTADALDVNSAKGIQNVIECSLYNASYEVAFELKSNNQQAITANRSLLNGVTAPLMLPGCDLNNLQPTNLTTAEHFSYLALMQALGIEAQGYTSIDLGNVSQVSGSSLAENPALDLISEGADQAGMSLQ